MDGVRSHGYALLERSQVNYQSSHEPSARPTSWACGLRTEPRMLYWQPSAELAPYVSGFHLYSVEADGNAPHRDAFQPAWGNLRVLLAGGEGWRVRPAKGEWIEPGPVSLFGPSSSLTWSESDAGLVVGAGIRPRGWLRLFSQPARDWANRVAPVPADAFDPHAILTRFCALEGDDDVPRAFEALLNEALGPPTRDDEAVGRIEAALVDPAILSVRQLAETAQLSIRSVERLAHRAFGFPPKLLLRRARFLRSLHAIRHADPARRSTAIDPAYTDYSHFIRDSHDFLGMSPQAFLQLDLPLLKQSLVLRKAVLGASAQALAAPQADRTTPRSGQ